ncbi:MAG: hypothetical protein LBO67_05400 [Spirochaetaceae bacterium]|nr:hypothetical protein [Spirochaetaceae bacterium]
MTDVLDKLNAFLTAGAAVLIAYVFERIDIAFVKRGAPVEYHKINAIPAVQERTGNKRSALPLNARLRIRPGSIR